MNLKKVNIKENKKVSLETPKFVLTYEQNKTEEKIKQESFEIVSKLVKDNEVLIEINSELLCFNKNEREDFMQNLLRRIKEKKYNFRYKKIPQSNKNILSLDFFLKSKDNHNILFYVSSDMWKNEIIDILPIFGVKYFIFKEKIDVNLVLDQMNNGQILGEEIFDICNTIVFDCATLGQMGIYTKFFDLENIKKNIFG